MDGGGGAGFMSTKQSYFLNMAQKVSILRPLRREKTLCYTFK